MTPRRKTKRRWKQRSWKEAKCRVRKQPRRNEFKADQRKRSKNRPILRKTPTCCASRATGSSKQNATVKLRSIYGIAQEEPYAVNTLSNVAGASEEEGIRGRTSVLRSGHLSGCIVRQGPFPSS